MLYPDFLELLHVLESHNVEYAIIGGYAVGLYAEPRYTKDLDILINPTKKNATSVLAALGEFGAPIDNLTIKDLSTPGLVYVFGIAPLRIDIINRIKGADVSKIVKRAQTVSIATVSARLVSFDDLITLKKLAGRPQDKADIKALERAKKYGKK